MRIWIAALALVALCACANRRTTDVDVEDASQAFKVKFGTVLQQRSVNVRSESSGAIGGGAMLGGGAGALLGQSNGAVAAGLLLGAFAGDKLHEITESGNGVEYTIALADGDTVVIAQLQGGDERAFQPGDAVMVQYGSTVNRVLAAADLPLRVARPKAVEVAGATGSKIGVRTCDKASSGRGSRESCSDH